ncbi:hypothetical protein TYRP_019407 [Tyrophagus putrescentiae]|nr:hypothetical protein TYRP_019407 [Tyrophagus putrescentiae]
MTTFSITSQRRLIATGGAEGDATEGGKDDGGDGRTEEVGDVRLRPHLVEEHARGKVQQLVGGWAGGAVGGRGEGMLKVQRKVTVDEHDRGQTFSGLHPKKI